MNRENLQTLAEERVRDAKTLLDGGRWSGAFYLAGYAVECGLKSCILARIERTGVIFTTKEFQKECWTHDIEKLVKAADLDKVRGLDQQKNLQRALNWQEVRTWSEIARYDLRTEDQARGLYRAVVDPDQGVLSWIKNHW